MEGVNRRRFLRAAGGTALFAAGMAGARPLGRGLPAPARAEENFFTWSQLSQGVHAAVDQTLGGNAMVINSAGQALLVDTKFPAFAAGLAREGAAFGAAITRVINTHHHGDHTGGNAVLNSDAEIFAHHKAAERIADQLDTYVQQARGGPGQAAQAGRGRAGLDAILAEAQAAAEASAGWDKDSAVPDSPITEWPREVTVGEIKLVLYHFGPGHTDNDVVVHIPDLNIIHTGDLCFHGLHPYFDPPGGARCQGWSESVGKTVELCDDRTIVVPGHGPVTDLDGLRAQKVYLDRLWDHVGDETRKGKTKEDITAMSWDFMDGLGFEQVRGRAIGAVYDERRPDR